MGIPTVSIFVRAFRHRAAQLQVPRVLVTPNLMGRTVGPVNDPGAQRRTVEAALSLLTDADTAPTIHELAG